MLSQNDIFVVLRKKSVKWTLDSSFNGFHYFRLSDASSCRCQKLIIVYFICSTIERKVTNTVKSKVTYSITIPFHSILDASCSFHLADAIVASVVVAAAISIILPRHTTERK